MTDAARSVRGVPIRLTAERWTHIVEHHDDLAGHFHDVLGTIATPDAVYDGDGGEFLAAAAQGGGRWLVVAYRETSAEDGFVITAFFTSRTAQIERRPRIWTRG